MERPESPATRSQDSTGQMTNEAAELAEDTKQRAKNQAETHKQTVAHQADSIAGAVGSAAEQFRQQDQQSLAEYASQLAGEMKHFADSLRGRSVDELLRDTQQFARQNPAAFFLGSLAIGFALSRFVKASASTSADHQGTPQHIELKTAGATTPPASSTQATGFGEN